MLTHEHDELVKLIEELEPEQVQRVLEFTRKVKAEPPMDYCDEWTDEELREVANESLRRLDESDPYDWPDWEPMPDVILVPTLRVGTLTRRSASRHGRS